MCYASLVDCGHTFFYTSKSEETKKSGVGFHYQKQDYTLSGRGFVTF